MIEPLKKNQQYTKNKRNDWKSLGRWVFPMKLGRIGWWSSGESQYETLEMREAIVAVVITIAPCACYTYTYIPYNTIIYFDCNVARFLPVTDECHVRKSVDVHQELGGSGDVNQSEFHLWCLLAIVNVTLVSFIAVASVMASDQIGQWRLLEHLWTWPCQVLRWLTQRPDEGLHWWRNLMLSRQSIASTHRLCISIDLFEIAQRFVTHQRAYFGHCHSGST